MAEEKTALERMKEYADYLGSEQYAEELKKEEIDLSYFLEFDEEDSLASEHEQVFGSSESRIAPTKCFESSFDNTEPEKSQAARKAYSFNQDAVAVVYIDKHDPEYRQDAFSLKSSEPRFVERNKILRVNEEKEQLDASDFYCDELNLAA